MALFHLSVTQTKRSAGQSAIASAAYRSVEKLYSEYYGEHSDYTRKGGVICSDILLPSHAPPEYADRQTLWNAVEKAERGKNAQLAYSFDIALQNEFSLEENIALARQFLLENFVSRGMVVDFAVHQPDREDGGIPNPHFHVLCPIRPIEQNGKWGLKQRRVYELDEDGKPVDKDAFSMKIGNRTYTDKKEADATLIDMCRSAKQPNMAVTIGEFQGFKMSVSFDSFFSKFTISLKGSLSHEVEIGADPLGNLQRLSNALEGMTGKMADVEQKLSNVEHQLETAKVEVTKPFAQEQELSEKLERLAELNALLNMDEKGDNALDMGDDEPEDETGEHSTQAQEGEPDRAEDIQAVADEPLKPVASFLMSERIAEHDKERMLADGSKGRVSVKEKLAEMKQKISDQKMPEKPEVIKSKGKEESL